MQINSKDIKFALNNWAKYIMDTRSVSYSQDSYIPIFIQYLNYRSKIVFPKPRKVTFSKLFEQQANQHSNKIAISKLKIAFEEGKDVNAYLSKDSLNASKFDGLLDYYGVKHFHLGESIENGFVKRTKDLALVFVNNDEAFFLAIKPHGMDAWHNPDVLEILDSEKPELIKHAKIQGKTNMIYASEYFEDMKGCRKLNINTFIPIQDSFFFPLGGGRTVAGCNAEHVVAMDIIVEYLEEYFRVLNGIISLEKIRTEFIFGCLKEFKIDRIYLSESKLDMKDIHVDKFRLKIIASKNKVIYKELSFSVI